MINQFTRKTAIPQDMFLYLVSGFNYHTMLILSFTNRLMTWEGQYLHSQAEIICRFMKNRKIYGTTLSKFWWRVVDDVYSILKRIHLENFLHHIKNLYQNFMFTMDEESNKEQVFLDTLLKQNNRKISILVYRKPTHTDQHLHYISHHLRSFKESVVSSFFSRAYSFFINKYGFTRENARIKQMLKENGYQESAISKIFNRIANNLSFTQLQQQTRATISKRKRSERV